MYSNSISGKAPRSGWPGPANSLNLKENETLGFSSKRSDAKYSDKINVLQSDRAPNSRLANTRSIQPESGIEPVNSKSFQSVHATKSNITDQKSGLSNTNSDGAAGSTDSGEKLGEKVLNLEESRIKSMELPNLAKNDNERADELANNNNNSLEKRNIKEIKPQNELPTLVANGSTDLVSKFKGRGPATAFEAAASTIFTSPDYAQKFAASCNLLDLATTIFKNDLDNTLAQIETSNDILQESLELK